MEQVVSYKEVSLGRPAIFYLPSDKMGTEIVESKTCRQVVETFLSSTYGGFTDEGNSHNGYWKNEKGKHFNDRYQKYQVSFLGKERVPGLKEFLAQIAVSLKEECIYLQTGEDSLLIYPT